MDRMLSQAERQKKTKVPQTTPQETAPTFAQRATSFEGGKGLSLPGKRTTHTGTQLRTPDPHNFFAISSDKAASHPTPSFTETTESAKASTPELRPVSHYFPAWRQELGALFSEEQLDAIEKAFEVTDN